MAQAARYAFSQPHLNDDVNNAKPKPLETHSGALSYLGRLFSFHGIHPNLRENFEKYGAEFGVFNIREFENMARRFYKDALNSNDSLYTVILMPRHRSGIDYNGSYRGIYEADGTPIAFFRPNYREQGFNSKDEELRFWRTTNVTNGT
jgi:hypothetical protein